MRIVVHYIGIMLVVPFYGIQVCPFLESMDPLELAVTIDAALLLALMSRAFLARRVLKKVPLTLQASRVFLLDLGVLVIAGGLLAVYNLTVNGFPLASGAKLMLGLLAMAMFAATDSALAHERRVAARVERDRLVLGVNKAFFPLTTKLIYYAVAFLLLMVGVFSLLVIKDLDWLVAVGDRMSLAQARVSILKEFGFVLVLTLGHAGNIIWSFSSNLNLFINRENGILERVAAGSYDLRVPISSNDEFAVMAEHTNEMIRRIRERTLELNQTRDVTILTLASLAETRDNETGAHILRTQRYVRALALKLRENPAYAPWLDDQAIDLLFKSAPLHDIGKVGIPDDILLKPARLSAEEFEVMKRHTLLGADALKIAQEQLGTNSFLHVAREIALTHHEKWDGSGYPSGLRGDAIPLSGRLMAIADVYDALISERVYKPAYPHEKAMRIIRDGRGNHFDPAIVDALDAIEPEFVEIAKQYSDERYLQHPRLPLQETGT